MLTVVTPEVLNFISQIISLFKQVDFSPLFFFFFMNDF